MKTGSESIQAIMRRRRILFAGFVARMEDTRLPKCVVFGELQQNIFKYTNTRVSKYSCYCTNCNTEFTVLIDCLID